MTGGSAKSRSSRQGARSNWVWGAFRMPGAVLHELHRLWRARSEADEYFGTLVNAWLAEGGEAVAMPAGMAYVDVGTLGGYREAMRLLAEAASHRMRGASRRCRSGRDDADAEPSPHRLRREVAALGPWFHNIDLGGVSDRPRPFPRRLSRGQMAAFRACPAGGSDRENRARYRLQRRLLLARNEAARRRPRARYRPRRGLSESRRVSRPR